MVKHLLAALLLVPTNLYSINSVPSPYNYKDLVCLAKNIYHESRGEPEAGKLAVGYVTMNRSVLGTRSICSVVYEKSQFSWTKDKTKHKVKVPYEYLELANTVIRTHTFADFPATHFHNTTIKPGWKKRKVARIGNHIFYV